VKSRFQSLPFKCNLQRYNTVKIKTQFKERSAATGVEIKLPVPAVGLCTLESS
jgi:hypothetical protein